ncbi:acyltransferase [Aromatoleum toluolicum]|uniref:Acyltransferase family protein n=2 Tax=Aromatoleum toluolicum TaxID=90060 RepID=A0ABX1NEJ2_9RHOO|nr:acyltransferase [Aromatoleum toluolicum]
MSDRILFAHLLRGVGAILVLISHYIGIFWIMHPDISSLLGAPVIVNFPKLHLPLRLIADYCIVFGQLGVGVFFILSGFVIPFSLENSSKGTFLVRRAIRIYPVYIVGFCLVILSILTLSHFTDSLFKYSIKDIVAHFGVITRGPLGVGRIDGISWTLEVELYFYISMAIFGSLILSFDAKKFSGLACLIALSCSFYLASDNYLIGVQIASGLLLVLGIAYFSFLKERISIKEIFVIEVVVFLLIFVLWVFVAKTANYTMQWMTGYLLAIAVFHTCFALREKIGKNALISHFSDISYPLYVVHALFGYAIMYILVDIGSGAYLAIILASISAYIAALAIHAFVEKPTMRLAKAGGWRNLAASKT